MDQVNFLTDIVQQTVAGYNNVIDWKARSYYLEDTGDQVYVVLDVPNGDHPLVKKPGIVVMARVVGENIIIEEDTTDKPLYDALIHNAHIPREQIVLAYAGEKVPGEQEQPE